MKSILQKSRKCLICGLPYVECHHVYGGTRNRRLSEEYGLKVYLCHKHHNEPPDGVHYNREFRDKLQEWAQKQFDTYYPTENFVELFGKNYEN